MNWNRKPEFNKYCDVRVLALYGESLCLLMPQLPEVDIGGFDVSEQLL